MAVKLKGNMKKVAIETIISALSEADLPYLIVGGVAVLYHGYPRMTIDLDLVIKFEAEIIHRTFRILAELGYKPLSPVTADAFANPEMRKDWVENKNMTVLRFHSDEYPHTPVNLFVDEPFPFDEEYAKAKSNEFPVVSLGTLLRMKQNAGRAIDLADIEQLRMLHPDV